MAERDTADARFSRMLELVPLASRSGGIRLTDLAEQLGIPVSRLAEDVQEICARSYYHPAGSGDDLQISIGPEFLQLFTTREFQRPTRLTPPETLALGLGLRIIAMETPDAPRPALIALAERLENGVLGVFRADPDGWIAVNTGAEEVRAELTSAAQKRLSCSITYVKAGAPEPDERSVDPYALVVTDGKWYLIAFCHRNEEIRVFRTDRVLHVVPLDTPFVVPEGFDPKQYVRGGRVFLAGEEMEVPVRYSARIARWIAEKGPVERQDDGSVIIRHKVADPVWLVRHVLEHGPDAEVLGPPEMRARVAAAAAHARGNKGS